MTEPAAIDNRSPWEKASAWIFGQPAYITRLCCILASIGYGAWYGLPALVTQIQDGYKELDSRHAAERKEMREDNKLERAETLSVLKELSATIERVRDKN